MTERILTKEQNPVEYNNLRMAADIMTAMSDEGFYFYLKEVYFDFGTEWMWTTIIKMNTNETGVLRTCQAINSKQWKLIVSAQSKSELLEIMKSIIE